MHASLLPPSATRLERALERALEAEYQAIRTELHTLWDADTCPASYLGHLAWAVGVEEWDTQWPEAVKRNAVREAPLINARRGTLWAVQRVLHNAGVLSEIREWFDPVSTPFSSTAPGTFDITVFVASSLTAGSDSREVTSELLARIHRMVDAAKPVSRHYNLRAALGIDAKSDIAVANVGTAFALFVTGGALLPYHPSAHAPLALASTGTAWQHLPTHGTLQ